MKFKNEKGITAIDVAMSIFIVAVFITINVSLSYNAMMKSKNAVRSEKATYYAVKIAEEIQGKNYTDVESEMNITTSLDVRI